MKRVQWSTVRKQEGHVRALLMGVSGSTLSELGAVTPFDYPAPDVALSG
jgi:hypothetical protein